MTRTAGDELTLYACSAEAIPKAECLESLRRLRILGCALEDLDFLRHCAALAELEVNFTLVRDPSPILELPALRSAILLGNPLDRETTRSVAERLKQEPRGDGRPALLVLPNDDEWRIQQQLDARNFHVGFACIDIHGAWDTAIAVRPGIGKGDDVDFVETWVSIMDKYIGSAPPGTPTDAFFASMFMDRAAADRGASRLSTHVTVGDAGDAERWVEAARLPDGDLAALRRFVARFPTACFFREDAVLGARIGAEAGVTFPDWFLALRSRALTSVEPRRRVLMRFDAFDGPHSPRAEYANTIWYELNLRPIEDPYVAKMYETCGAFPIGRWPAEMRSTLVIPLAADDGRILECAEADLFDARADGRNPTGSMYVAFESYASMLGHVVEIMVDGEAIKAR